MIAKALEAQKTAGSHTEKPKPYLPVGMEPPKIAVHSSPPGTDKTMTEPKDASEKDASANVKTNSSSLVPVGTVLLLIVAGAAVVLLYRRFRRK